jgi:hypothetical protein
MYMAQYATYQSGEPKKQRIENAEKKSGWSARHPDELTNAEAAAMVGVSDKSIREAKIVLQEGHAIVIAPKSSNRVRYGVGRRYSSRRRRVGRRSPRP